MNYQHFYSRFLAQNKQGQHYAAHSHHYWPDVTREAMIQYWDDSAQYTDQKWEYFFSQKIPKAQKHIAKHLNVKNWQQIAFASNTHEFVVRLLSCFPHKEKIKILTTDSEFYSFDRQIKALIENQLAEVDVVSTAEFSTFETRFVEQSLQKKYDLVFLSQVFFNSGFVIQELTKLVQAIPKESLIAIDGYHGFMAVPTDLSSVQDRVFYLAGSYKYAQGGEGCCFMYIPPSCALRPVNTGWFASFGALKDQSQLVSYADTGFRFAGSTMDFTAVYRLNAVMDLLEQENLQVLHIHEHIQQLQNRFLEVIREVNHKELCEDRIVNHETREKLKLNAHFYAFNFDSVSQTETMYQLLKNNMVLTDFRGTRLRFGFGLYQNEKIQLNFLKT